MSIFRPQLLIAMAMACTFQAFALEQDITVELEGLVYSGDGDVPGRFDSDTSASLELEFSQVFNDGNTIAGFKPFGRWDSRDPERRHADIQELNVIHVMDDIELLAGISKVFWGVTESAHLVDIVNQTDYLEGFDGEDKLGQPMVRLSKSFSQSTLSAFVLPFFREREFLSPDNPLSLPFEVNNDSPRYESDDEDSHIDYALRYNGYQGIVDYGISFFSGTSRDPEYVPGEDGRLIPFYPLIDQFGLDLQITREAWLWKLEAIRRDFQNEQPTVQPNRESYSAAVAGFEYSFYGMRDGLFDLGLLLEYHHDSRDDPSTVAFQNDLFAGTRFGFNDAQSSEILAGAFVDLDDDSLSFRVEASRRIIGDARLSIEAQAFSNVDADNLFFSFQDSDFLRLTVELFF